MRRRLTVIMTLMVAGSLLLTGAVTLVLTVRATRQQTRHELIAQAQSLGAAVQAEADAANPRDPPASLRNVLRVLKAPLHLEGEAVLGVRPNGDLFDPANPAQKAVLPSGLTAADIDPAALARGQTVSGTAGVFVYAAAPFRATVLVRNTPVNLLQVVILTRSPPTGLSSAGPWFAFSSALIVLIALVVASRLGKRMVRPLRAAEEVTRRIAAGDLAARVPAPPAADTEVVSLATSINALAASLARARGVERQFLLSVSHDLRTPLTSIRGFAEAIEDGATTDTARAAAVIAAEARRLERLVGDLLDLAELGGSRFSLQVRRVDLAEIVADTAEGFLPASDELGLRLDVDGGLLGTVPVAADPDRLAQVVANLVENALKYATAHVRVGAARSGGLPVLWVDDDGPGILPGDLDHVFDRLFLSRAQPGRRVGSGLGLAIVAELVAAMGGSVRAESPTGPMGGTRMVVTLRPWDAPDPTAPPI